MNARTMTRRRRLAVAATSLALGVAGLATAGPAAAVAPPQPSACGFSLVPGPTQGAAGTLVYAFTARPADPWQDCALNFALTASITTTSGAVPAGISGDPAHGSATLSFQANRQPPQVLVGWTGYCTTVAQPVVLNLSSGSTATSEPLGTSESCSGKGNPGSGLSFEPASATPSEVGIAPIAGGPGYRLTDDGGYVTTKPSDAVTLEPDSVAPVVGIATAPTANGFWLVAANGGVFTYGDAAFHGSAGNLPLTAPIVGMATDPVTGGYWLVAADGGVFSYDAPFFGSAGNLPLASPIVGINAAPNGQGYRLVAADGGVFSYGSGAPFEGSAGAINLTAPITAMATDPVTGGYWLFGADGGVFSYDAPFHGSAAGLPLAGPVDGAASSADGGGYLLLGADGGVFAYGDATYEGNAAADG